MRMYWSAIPVLFAFTAFAQQEDTAKKVYEQAHDSVFLVYVNDASGTPQALGSAFLVAPRTLITNAHVVDGGSPVLAVDPIRIPLKVLRIDSQNDLAVLSVEADLTSRPLPLATGKVSPGEQVFAIGNPKGLEKTISQGIVSGLRNIGTRNLIQITSPISHGSSGGPILNSKGEVIAVAVGILEEGQNLNFAVPVEYVKSLLESKNTLSSAESSPSSKLELAKELAAKLDGETYSSDENSEFQRETSQLIALVKNATTQASSANELNTIACFGANRVDLSDEGITAARRLLQKNPSPENRALLAYILFKRAQFEKWAALFSDKDSEEQKRAQSAQGHFLSEAEREATEVVRQSKGEHSSLANFVLGGVSEDRNEFTKAIEFHSMSAKSSLQTCGSDIKLLTLRDLIFENNKANRPEETERWFRHYASIYVPESYEWDSEGDRRTSANDHKKAAEAYEIAASGGTSYSYDFCFEQASTLC